MIIVLAVVKEQKGEGEGERRREKGREGRLYLAAVTQAQNKV